MFSLKAKNQRGKSGENRGKRGNRIKEGKNRKNEENSVCKGKTWESGRLFHFCPSGQVGLVTLLIPRVQWRRTKFSVNYEPFEWPKIILLTVGHICWIEAFEKSFRCTPFRAYHHLMVGLIPKVIAILGLMTFALPVSGDIKRLSVKKNKATCNSYSRWN